MYKEHKTFIQPKNENIKIWRYLDFAKFIHLIESQKLFFARVDKFNDQFEGSWPKNTRKLRDRLCAGSSEDERKLNAIALSKKAELLKQHFAVNCWHMNEHESAAMWNIYLKGNQAIAIQSTYSLLKISLIDAEAIYLGKVIYKDYQKETLNFYDHFAPFVHKRKSFKYEKEIRAVITKLPFKEEVKIDLNIETIKEGLLISVDLKNLIQKIYVAPNSPIWFIELVNNAVKRYGYEWNVVQSTMDENPWF